MDPARHRDDTIVSLLRAALPGALAIYRFGSAGTAFERPASDVDVAVWAGLPLPAEAPYELAAALAAVLGRDVHVVDLGRASTVLRAQVVTTGQRLFCADRTRVESFEDTVFSAYALLNEERAGILADIALRGTIHG